MKSFTIFEKEGLQMAWLGGGKLSLFTGKLYVKTVIKNVIIQRQS